MIGRSPDPASITIRAIRWMAQNEETMTGITLPVATRPTLPMHGASKPP